MNLRQNYKRKMYLINTVVVIISLVLSIWAYSKYMNNSYNSIKNEYSYLPDEYIENYVGKARSQDQGKFVLFLIISAGLITLSVLFGNIILFNSFKCFHCGKAIVFEKLNITCPFCDTIYNEEIIRNNFDNEKSYNDYFGVHFYACKIKKVLMEKCPKCKSKIRYLECPHCEKSIDLFAEYDEKEIERKIYG